MRNRFKELRDDKIRFVSMLHGKTVVTKYALNYSIPEDKPGDGGRQAVFICRAVNGRDRYSRTGIFSPEIHVFFKKRARLLGFRQLARLLDLDGRYEELRKQEQRFYHRIRYRGHSVLLMASLGPGCYAFIRLQVFYYHGFSTLFLTGLEVIAQYIINNIVRDIVAVLLKFNEIALKKWLPGAGEYIGVYQPYWELMDSLGAVPAEEIRDGPAYRVYRVDMLEEMLVDRLAKTEYLGVASITEDEEGRPKLFLLSEKTV